MLAPFENRYWLLYSVFKNFVLNKSSKSQIFHSNSGFSRNLGHFFFFVKLALTMMSQRTKNQFTGGDSFILKQNFTALKIVLHLSDRLYETSDWLAQENLFVSIEDEIQLGMFELPNSQSLL